MLATIGIADELKPKIRLLPSGLTTFDPVAAGDVHVAFGRLFGPLESHVVGEFNLKEHPAGEKNLFGGIGL